MIFAPALRSPRSSRAALAIGVVALAAAAIGGAFAPAEFFRGYLFACMFWIAPPLGAAMILMVHHLVGGGWGWRVRPLVISAIWTLPLVALMFVPLAWGAGWLYPWMREPHDPADPVARFRAVYLSPGFVLARSIFYFGAWTIVIGLLVRWSGLTPEEKPASRRAAFRLSSGGVVLFFLTATFAFIDWTGSLQAHWYSTIYGAYLLMSQTAGALALLILLVAWSDAAAGPALTPAETQSLHDLGNLLLMMIVFWAYLAFSQFFITWNGNLPHEIAWYLPRTSGAWGWVAVYLILFHFFIPFFLLLQRGAKRNPEPLMAIAGLIVFSRMIDVAWWVLPSFGPPGLRTTLAAVATVIGLGGLWIGAFLLVLQRRARAIGGAA